MENLLAIFHMSPMCQPVRMDHETHVNNAQCVDNAAGEAQDVLNHQKT